MDPERIFAATTAERHRLADVVEGLDAAQLARPSLCAGWDVKTVAAHVVSTVDDGTTAFVRLAVRRRSLAAAIDELARQRASRPAPEIVAALRRCASERVSPPLAGPRDPLADILVHQGDVRLALAMDFAPDPELADEALEFLTGRFAFGFVPRSRLSGLALRSTDSGGRWGAGAEVAGRSAALMMAACGRPALLAELDGPGAGLLGERIGPRG
jgi:uncharacterized protein (TIGR03083 family)